MGFRTSAVTLICAAFTLTTVSPALAADTEIIDLRGTGGRASFTFETDVEGEITTDIHSEYSEPCVEIVTTTVIVQVAEGSEHLRPGGPSSSSSLGVDVHETKAEVAGCDTDYQPFSGRGVASDFDFATDPDLGGGRLTALLALDGAGHIRELDLDVTWYDGVSDAVQSNEHARSAGGHHVVNEKQAGAVSVLSAIADIHLVGTPISSAVTSVPSETDGDAVNPSLWDTASRRITVTKDQPSIVSETASVTTSESTFTTASITTASTCTGGTWSGYWTATWTGTSWSWTWTWVYYPCDGGWTVS